MQMFCKEFVTWKALRHPNVLPLLGVTMTGTQFATISEWMINGNINEFVRAHPDVNRFELVRFRSGSYRPIIADNYVASVVERCRKRTGLYAYSGNGSWGFKGGTSGTNFAFYLLTDFMCQG